MRWWNSLMPQGGLTRSGHVLQTTYAMPTARRPTETSVTRVPSSLLGLAVNIHEQSQASVRVRGDARASLNPPVLLSAAAYDMPRIQDSADDHEAGNRPSQDTPIVHHGSPQSLRGGALRVRTCLYERTSE